MLFEIFIEPQFTNLDIIQKHLNNFFKFKNYINKHKIIIYTNINPNLLTIKKNSKINFIHINSDIITIKQLWKQNIELYNNEEWIIHYNLKDRLIEFDFIKMILKKQKNTFVKKNSYEIYNNLFCIDKNLFMNYILNDDAILNIEFIMQNTNNYYFLKYMNIISINEANENIYI